MPATAPLMALSRSASAKMMFGDLPPSSSDSLAKFSALLRTTWRAVAAPPVKAILRTSGWRVSAAPVLGP